ncbi:MAG: 2-dehydropantoate 2-reductase [Desulfobulbaceae bacterium]|nr:2-dehydropantoate 2-reductase [Desulfobulbaceae bacterium]
MKIAVIGPGALGSLFAAGISRAADHDLWLLDHNAQRAARLDNKLLLNENGRELVCPMRITADARDIGPVDLVLLCVKSADVADALALAQPLLEANTLLIPFQNGIRHLDVLHDLPFHVAIGVTAQGATLLAPGHVRHGGSGLTRINFLKPQSDRALKKLNTAVHLLNSCSFKTEISPNILSHVWAKLLVNVGINALTAILNCPNGDLLKEPARTRMVAAVREGAAVAKAMGIELPTDPVAMTQQVCRDTAANISSMLQDVRRGKKTEIEAINGALTAEAGKLNVPVPVNEELVRQVKELTNP